MKYNFFKIINNDEDYIVFSFDGDSFEMSYDEKITEIKTPKYNCLRATRKIKEGETIFVQKCFYGRENFSLDQFYRLLEKKNHEVDSEINLRTRFSYENWDKIGIFDCCINDLEGGKRDYIRKIENFEEIDPECIKRLFNNFSMKLSFVYTGLSSFYSFKVDKVFPNENKLENISKGGLFTFPYAMLESKCQPNCFQYCVKDHNKF